MSEILSSDILERQFGPTELEILWQDDKTRIICTKVADGGQVLELSQVAFHQAGIDGFPDIHKEIVDGKSMGKAFAGQGIDFNRQVRAAYEYDQRTLPAGFTERFGTVEPATVIDVSIQVGPGGTPYADILEVYSPAVSWNLNSGKVTEEVADRISAFGELLTMPAD